MANRIPLTPAELAAASPIQAVAGLTGDVAANDLQAALSLDNVTNDAQTRAAVVPNTAPAAGQVLLGNSGGTAYVPTTVSGDATISSAGVLTVTKTNGTSLGTMATQNAGAVVITGGTITGLSEPSGSTDAATKGYVDGFVSSPMVFQGSINCSTNPNYPAANKGDVYIVSAAGKVGGASGITVDIGDMVVALADNAGGTQAAVGSSWSTIEHNMQGALLAANNLGDLANAVVARSNLGLEIGVDIIAVGGDGSSLSNVVSSVAGLDGVISGSTLKSTLSLDNVTNHAQTQAAIVPNTAPAAGRILVGNAGGTAYAPVAVSGDVTLSSAGAVTVSKVGGVNIGTMATQNANTVTITGGSITGLASPTGSSDAATKGYVDGMISTPMSFKSSISCSANPNYPSAQLGDVYVVSAAGKIGGSGGVSVDIGDMIIAIEANIGGTYASVGSKWSILEHNLQGALLSANNLSDIASAVTARSNLGLVIGTDVLAPTGSGASLTNVVNSVAGIAGTVTGATLKAALSLDALTNDVQTKAAILPNTAPAAGRIPVGNAGGTAYAPVAVSGDATLSATGVITVTKTNGTSLGTMATQNAGAIAVTGGSVTGATLTGNTIAGGTITGSVVTGLSSPSGSTDAATKGYVDGLITNPLSFQTSLDCSTNPNYPAATKGFVYVVSVAGKIGGASGTSVDAGDLLLAIANNAGGTQASVGSSWTIVEHNLQGALLSANNLSDIANATTARSNLGLVIGTNVLAPNGVGSALTGITWTVAGLSGTISSSALRTAISISNVTNDQQTRSSILPNTAPAAGRIPVGNAGGTAYAPVAMSGDATLTSAGAITVTKTGGVNFGTMATQAASAVAITGGTITGMADPSSSGDVANKSYVDSAVLAAVSFKSTIDCSASPNYPSAIIGDTYSVSVAGKIGGASGTDVGVGDLLIATANNGGGTQASVGTHWNVTPKYDASTVLLVANNLSDITNATTARSNLGLVIGTNVLSPTGSGAALSDITQSVAGLSGTISDTGLKTALALDNVTNHAQTQAAVVPNTAPAAGKILVGNAGGTAYAPVSVSGDATLSSAGALTVTKTNGTSFGTMATQNANSVTITGGSITGMSSPSASSDVATKGYVDGLVTNPMRFMGSTDCSTNPNYPAATIGDVYVVSVAGKIGGASGTVVAVGDMFIANTTNAGGTQASVGANWSLIEHNLQGALLSANNLSDIASVSTARSNLGLVIGTDVLAPNGSGASLTNVVNSVASLTGTVSSSGLKTAISLDALTNDAQTKAAIVPNTAPAAGNILAGNAGGTAYASVAMSGDATLSSTGAITVTKTNGTSFGTMSAQNANSVTITGGSITGMSSPSSSSDVATKGYVDGLVSNPMRFMGQTDCLSNPNYPAALIGDTYSVSVAGKIGGASGISVDVGDIFIANTTNVGGTQAAVGSSWTIIEHNLQGALLSANNLSDIASASTARSNLGLVIGTDVLAPSGSGASLTGLTSTQVGLGSVTNDAQTKAAIVPNTAPSAGQLLAGNAGGTAYAPVAMSGDATIASTGAITVTKTNGSSFGTMAVQDASSVTITGGSITGLGTPSGSSDAATKGYVDGLVSSPMNFKSATDCSANPNYPTAIKGDTYVVSVAGKIGGASGTVVEVGDLYLAIANNAGGTQASVGTSWILIEHNLQGALLSANNLSDIANAGTARTNLGLEIGTHVQAYSAQLASVASLAFNGLIARNGTNTVVNRSVVGTTGLIVVADGDGVSGNPTITVGSDVLQTNVSQTISNQKTFTNNSLTDGATISWDVATAQNTKVTLGGNRTIAAPTNLVANGFYSLMIQQDGSGSKTVTWNSIFKWGDAGTPVLSTGANKRDMFSFYYDGTDMIGTMGVKGA